MVKRETEKLPIHIVATLDTAVATYHLLIRLEGLLTLQAARRLVGREKMLYTHARRYY